MSIHSHSAARLNLLQKIFWEILPLNYEKIEKRWDRIATLHSEAKSDLLATDRAAALNSLKAGLEMLEKEVLEYRVTVQEIDVTDIAGIYVVAGKSPHRALQKAKEDLENLEGVLKEIEEMVAELRADIRYGMTDQV